MFAPWKSDLKEKPTVLQSITLLTFSISVCFRALCFSPSRMTMGCCIMWQEALRVRSQLTRYVPKPCNFAPLNINMCLLASSLWLVDSLPNSLIFRFNTLLWKLILGHVFISTLFSLSLCIVNYDSELKLRKISVDLYSQCKNGCQINIFLFKLKLAQLASLEIRYSFEFCTGERG